jgi:hypothetical protein
MVTALRRRFVSALSFGATDSPVPPQSRWQQAMSTVVIVAVHILVIAPIFAFGLTLFDDATFWDKLPAGILLGFFMGVWQVTVMGYRRRPSPERS